MKKRKQKKLSLALTGLLCATQKLRAGLVGLYSIHSCRGFLILYVQRQTEEQSI